jgi:hypothetical protein
LAEQRLGSVTLVEVVIESDNLEKINRSKDVELVAESLGEGSSHVIEPEKTQFKTTEPRLFTPVRARVNNGESLELKAQQLTVNHMQPESRKALF